MKTILLLLAVTATSQAQWDKDQSGQNINMISWNNPNRRNWITNRLETFDESSDVNSQYPTNPPQDDLNVNEVVAEVFNPAHPPPFSTETPAVSGLNLENCVCVPYYQCRHGVFNENGVGLMEPRLKACDSNEVCCKRSDMTSNASSPPSPANICGVTKNNNFGKAFFTAGNQQAQFAEFPWMAAILNVRSLSYQCGGSLVHRQVVLTAAHCVKTTDFIVRLGEWDSVAESERLPHQDMRVVKYVWHPDFSNETLHHDLALLFLESPVTLADNVGTICLPESNDVFDDGSRCLVTGWGKSSYGKTGIYGAILKKIDVPIVNHGTCQSSLHQTRLGNVFKLHSSFMCAGGEAGKDACFGDGGGPLICRHPQDPARYTQVGVVSWGIGCGDLNVPGVYTNVATHRQWIDQQILENHALLAN